MPSFDITSEVNKVELHNAVDQSNKEITNRFDFKGSNARIEESEAQIILHADDDFKVKQMMEIFISKCAKRNVDVRAFEHEPIEKAGSKVKQTIKVKDGIESDMAKKIVKSIKDAKLKVTATIQGNAVRVAGTKKDDLQTAIQHVRKEVTEIPVQFGNFRD